MTGHSSEAPLVYKAVQVSELLGLGLNQVYEGIKRGEIPSCRVGRRILVPRKRLLDMINGESSSRTDSEAGAGTPANATTPTPPRERPTPMLTRQLHSGKGTDARRELPGGVV